MDRMYECLCCGDKDLSETLIKLHNRDFHRGMKFLCKDCINVFKSEDRLLEHNRIVHGVLDIDTMLYCDHCEQSKQFHSTDALWKHTIRCHGNYTHLCSICKNKYETTTFSTSTKPTVRLGSRDGFMDYNLLG